MMLFVALSLCTGLGIARPHVLHASLHVLPHSSVMLRYCVQCGSHLCRIIRLPRLVDLLSRGRSWRHIVAAMHLAVLHHASHAGIASCPFAFLGRCLRRGRSGLCPRERDRAPVTSAASLISSSSFVADLSIQISTTQPRCIVSAIRVKHHPPSLNVSLRPLSDCGLLGVFCLLLNGDDEGLRADGATSNRMLLVCAFT